MIWALLSSQLYPILLYLGLHKHQAHWLPWVSKTLCFCLRALEQSLSSVQGQVLVHLLLTASHLSGLIPDTHTSLPKRAPQEEGLIE